MTLNVQETAIEELNASTIQLTSAEPVHDSADASQTIVKSTELPEISDATGHCPVGDSSEAPALKKQRFLKAELVSVPQQSLERGSSSKSQDVVMVSEAAELAKKESVQMEELSREPSGQLQEVGNETLEVSDLPTMKNEDQFLEAPALQASLSVAPQPRGIPVGRLNLKEEEDRRRALATVGRGGRDSDSRGAPINEAGVGRCVYT